MNVSKMCHLSIESPSFNFHAPLPAKLSPDPGAYATRLPHTGAYADHTRKPIASPPSKLPELTLTTWQRGRQASSARLPSLGGEGGSRSNFTQVPTNFTVWVTASSLVVGPLASFVEVAADNFYPLQYDPNVTVVANLTLLDARIATPGPALRPCSGSEPQPANLQTCRGPQCWGSREPLLHRCTYVLLPCSIRVAAVFGQRASADRRGITEHTSGVAVPSFSCMPATSCCCRWDLSPGYPGWPLPSHRDPGLRRHHHRHEQRHAELHHVHHGLHRRRRAHLRPRRVRPGRHPDLTFI